MTDKRRDDYDSPWKEALDHYFPEFLALLYPRIHAEIDWSKGHEFLDKELQQVVRDAVSGRRYADKLVKVATRDGAETWVLVHVEVQGESQAGFAERMYVYNYRLFDRHRIDIVSLGVLADDSPRFRPRFYRRSRWGCDLHFRFPIQKLLDWRRRWEELEASANPFALVVMAHLKAQESKDGATRKGWKLRLIRLLYERDYSREAILELFRVIDWLLQLPKELEREFLQELITFEEQKKMPYVTSAERFGWELGYQKGRQERQQEARQEGRQEGHQEGHQEGREKGCQEGEATIVLRLIALKFGDPGEAVRERIRNADAETLLRWSERLLTAQTLDEIWSD